MEKYKSRCLDGRYGTRKLRKLAKNRIMEALSVAYYHFSDGCNEEYNELSEAEQEQVMKLLNQYGKAIGKMLGEEYYTV